MLSLEIQVQQVTVERIIDMFNHDVLPVVKELGSLGASGDLAPLANLFLPLIGEGEVFYKGKIYPAKEINACRLRQKQAYYHLGMVLPVKTLTHC